MKIEVVKTNSTETSTGIERYVTRGKSYVKWTELEDMALQSKNERQLSYLLKTKGQEEVDRRATFLGIVV